MPTELEQIYAEMQETPQFVKDAEKARASNPGLMHLRAKIKPVKRYEHSEMAYDDFDQADNAGDWEELDQLIQDELDSMSDASMSDDDSVLSETEDNDEWTFSDASFDPTWLSDLSSNDSWVSESAQLE